MRKAVVGWEGFYEVSDAGEVFSLCRLVVRSDGTVQNWSARQMATPLNSSGYPCVRLSRPGVRTMARVHRLVAQAFLENPLHLSEVNHIDGNKANPASENLEWCTASQNRHHAFHVLRSIVMPPAGKLNFALAQAMRSEHVPGVYGCRRLAKKYGVAPSSARAILAGRTYRLPLPAAPNQGENHVG